MFLEVWGLLGLALYSAFTHPLGDSDIPAARKTYREFISCPDLLPAIVAHRAAWHKYPENSIAAVEDAISQGYDVAEIDIRQSKDGQFFIFHDATLNRMTGMKGSVKKKTLDELTKIRLRNRDGGSENRDLTEHTIPTLRDILRVARGRIYLDLDVKSFKYLPGVAALVREEGMQDEVDIKTDVLDQAQADYAKELEDQYGLMVMPKTGFNKTNVERMLSILKSLGPAVVETKVRGDLYDFQTLADHAHDFRCAGISLWVNTLTRHAFPGFSDALAVDNPQSVWGRLIESGINVVQTDEFELLNEFRQSARKLPDCGCRDEGDEESVTEN